MKNTILTNLSAGQLDELYRAGHWRDDTIYMLARQWAGQTPQAIAVRDSRRAVSYQALVAAADRLAARLQARGVRAGQRVAVWASSRAEVAVAILACSRNSYVCCPSLHRDHTVADVLQLLRRMRAAAFIGEFGYGADAKTHDIFQSLADIPSIVDVITLSPASAHEAADPDIWRETGPLDATEHATDPNRVIYLAFTSGTTDAPKGVIHSDNTLLSNARAMARSWAFGQDAVLYTLSPLSHNLGFGALITTMCCGGQLVVHDLARGASVLGRIVEVGATFLFGVPTHAIDLLAELRRSGGRSLGRLKGFRISGAAAPREVVAELLDHGVVPQSGYGMTEACSHHYTLPTDDPAKIIGTSGRACPGYEISIWSIADPEVEAAPGEIGQIGGRGASLMLGYFENQQATEAAFNSRGWFMTGDLGRLDEDGFLIITGRKKDLIIRGGHNIYPARIEALAMQCPGVLRAAAFPVPDHRLGEKACLAVMLKTPGSPSAAELLQHLDAAGLSKYDMPEYFAELDEIPVTASGKVFKRALVLDLAAGKLTVQPVRHTASAELPA